jgi:signal transduction histidine kinase
VEPRAELRVLVVEDSEDDYELLVNFLGRGPWRVQARRVEDAAGLRGALAAERWDVIVSDHSLPRFDSTAALRIVRETDRQIPFIIVSGQIGEDFAVDAMLAGADDYVMKHNLARLRPAVQRCLAASELRREKAEAERAKGESEARLAAIAENLPGAVFQLRHGAGPARFAYLSPGAAPLLGHPDRAFLDSFAEQLAGAVGAGRPLRWEGSLAAAGAKRWLAVSGSPRSDANEQVWDGIMMDVSALKSAEQALRRSREALSELTAHWEARMEKERAAIARELHDDVGGTLTALKVDIEQLRRASESDARFIERAAEMARLVDSLIEASTRLAGDLRPAELDFGLSAALEVKAREFEKRVGIPCRFRTNDEELVLDAERARALVRVFQEALTNVTKHARATRVEAELFATESEVTLEVRDDGRGFLASDLARRDSFGVRGMHERVGRVGGWLEVSGEPGKGTTVMASIPRPRVGEPG